MILLALVLIIGCSADKPLIPKDEAVKTATNEEVSAPKNPEEQERVYVYDIIKKEKYWMNKTTDAGISCKVAAECQGWCEPVEGNKKGKCSWFPTPIGCKKRLERAEIFDVCANLTIQTPP